MDEIWVIARNCSTVTVSYRVAVRCRARSCPRIRSQKRAPAAKQETPQGSAGPIVQSRDRVLANDTMRSNCLANADEFVEATEQVNDRQAHAEKARYLAHAQQRTRRPG